MGLIVGIDLGTTFSAAAKLDDTGRPVIVHDSDGANITPSVVKFTGPSATIVGQEARKELGQPNVFGRFKRRMGTDETYKSSYGEHTPTELSTFVLRKLKEETEKVEHAKIDEVVVTIPANFSNEAREATLAAAKAAGLNIRYIINEPTAAAMYFAQSGGKELAGVYAVFDLGGGTFDVTIMRVNGKQIDVLATEGVNKLGGDDFDTKLTELVAARYAKQTGGTLRQDDFSPNDAEELKKSLSKLESKSVRVQGSAGSAMVEIKRQEFVEAISTHIAQMEMLCEAAVDEAKISLSDIREVILAGGSTRIPAVQESVKRCFKKDPVTFGNPDEVVALGAAIYAAFRADATKLNPLQKAAIADVKISDITSKFFGTLVRTTNEAKQVEEITNAIVIKKGTKVPATVTQTYYTVHENQTAVDCTVTEANSAETDKRFVRIIWQGDLGPLPGGRPAGKPIEVTFSYTANQTMSCSFKDVESGKRTDIDLSMVDAKGGDDFDIEKFTVE